MSDETDPVAELMARIDAVVLGGMAEHPRSLQVAPGPSDLGDPCDVCLAKVLVGIKPPADSPLAKDSWQATVGTFIHAGLEGYFDADNGRHGIDPADQPWYLERKVHVGDLDDLQVWGSSDLYDKVTGTVIDWKTVSPSAMGDAKLRTAHTAKGRKRHYRAQAHLYGRGYARLGYDVRRVLLCYVWRDGKWLDHTGGEDEPRDPRQTGRFAWSEPYDETVATDALDRATTLLRAARAAQTAGLLDEHLASLKPHYRCYDCGKAKRHATLTEEEEQAEGVVRGRDDTLSALIATPADRTTYHALAGQHIAALQTRDAVARYRAERHGDQYWDDHLDTAARQRWSGLPA